MHYLKQTRLLVASFGILLFCLNSSFVSAQSKDEIINGSYLVSFGRFANSSELSYWRQNVGSKNVQQMVANHKDYLRSNSAEREQAIRRSYMDAFGWQPSADELKYWSGQNKTYAELLQNHVQNWLNVYPDKKSHVIKQSYYKVFGRTANADELKYWMGQATCSYAQYVAIHSTWKLNNQKSSSLTRVNPNLKNNNGISTSSFSPTIGAQVVAAGGLNVIAPGGGNVVAAGGLN
ncbi:MAG: hypothetical protein EOO06_05180 [Chitinophagaceae bacterium]|nr:MAG: hypothetical protein EOO06_05180 [Chitinophagaceae bacterium]